MTKHKNRKRKKKYRINYKRFIPFIIILIVFIILISKLITFVKSPKKRKDENLSYLTSSNISSEDKSKDLDYLLSIVKNSYINYDFVDLEKRKEFEEKVIAYKNRSEELTDIEFRAAIGDILSTLGDENLRLLSKNDIETYKKDPYKGSVWEKTLESDFIAGAMENVPLIPEKKVVNKNPGAELVVKELTKEVLYIKPSEFYEENIEADIAKLQTYYPKLQNYDGIIIDVSNRGGSDYKYFYDLFLKPLSNRDLFAFLRLAKKNEFFSSFGNDFNKVYKEFYSIKEEFKIGEIPPEVNTDTSIRENFKSYYRLDMNVAANPNSNFSGEIFLVQNEMTEGAPDLFAYFSKASGFASLVGSKSKGGLYMDQMPPGILVLPESKYPVAIPFVSCLSENGSLADEGTSPQIEIKIDSKAAYVNTLVDIIQSN